MLDQMTPKGSRVLSSTGLFLRDRLSTLLLHTMSRWIAGLIMNVPVHFYVLLGWIGQILSISIACVPGCYSYTNLTFSTKENLRSGEMEVPRDQWPVFLYADYQYDAEDAWKGLFRSTLLVSVSYFLLLDTIY